MSTILLDSHLPEVKEALPQEVMARPGMVDRILEIAGTHEAVVPPGPSRQELLHMLA